MQNDDASVVTAFIPAALSIHARQLRHYIDNVADQIAQATPDEHDEYALWRAKILHRARKMLVAFDGLVLAAQQVQVICRLNVEQLEAQAAATRDTLKELETA